jgi:predicted PurR-regulated permease PerM
MIERPTPIPEQAAPDRVSARAASHQRITTAVVDIALVALGFWVLRGFFSALAWAVVLTVATWPLYERFQMAFAGGWRRNAAPLLFTLLIALVFIGPFSIAGIEGWREMKALIQWLGEVEKTGIPAPATIAHIPYLGSQITQWWTANLSEPGAVADLVGRTDTGFFARITQQIGLVVARRLTLFAFTILSLFFLFRNGVTLGQKFRTLCHRLLGQSGEYLRCLTTSAIRGTADGLVLVGLGEGAVLTVAYEIIGAPHPALLGVFTGLLAIIPFGAPVMFSLAALLVAISGNVVGGAVIFAVGVVVVGFADHFIRPALIGGAAKLPFIWVLFGIFGGLETFGLVGLFLGPAIMAAVVSLWREWTDPVPRRLMQKAS